MSGGTILVILERRSTKAIAWHLVSIKSPRYSRIMPVFDLRNREQPSRDRKRKRKSKLRNDLESRSHRSLPPKVYPNIKASHPTTLQSISHPRYRKPLERQGGEGVRSHLSTGLIPSSRIPFSNTCRAFSYNAARARAVPCPSGAPTTWSTS